MIPDMSRPPPNFNAPPPNLPAQDLMNQPAVNIMTGMCDPVQLSRILAEALHYQMPIVCTAAATRAMGQFEDNAVVVPTPASVIEDTKPTAPYYELPAGLMVPLIRLEDCSYHPLDPEEIRLPAPAPPSERLLQAIDAFYSMPSHDRPRDG